MPYAGLIGSSLSAQARNIAEWKQGIFAQKPSQKPDLTLGIALCSPSHPFPFASSIDFPCFSPLTSQLPWESFSFSSIQIFWTTSSCAQGFWQCLEITFEGPSVYMVRTICSALDWTWVSCMRGKHTVYCTITEVAYQHRFLVAPTSFYEPDNIRYLLGMLWCVEEALAMHNYWSIKNINFNHLYLSQIVEH